MLVRPACPNSFDSQRRGYDYFLSLTETQLKHKRTHSEESVGDPKLPIVEVG
jgi:hypothetical protein